VTSIPVGYRRQQLPFLVALPVVLLLWVLPFHSLTIAYFFGALRTSMQATMLLASWKEGVALFLIVVVAARAVLSRGPRATISAPDIAITGLIAVAVLFALVENHIFGAEIPGNVELFGFRSSVFFMFLYYAGRGIPEIGNESIYVRHAFRVAVVVATLGVLERIFVSPQMLVTLGAAAYVSDFLGLTASTAGNEWGLPSNYWSTLGGTSVRRAGSVFLGGQAFALPFLLLIPAATCWVFDPSRRRGGWAVTGYALVWLGLLLTITRVTILVCTVQVLVYFLITRRPTRAVATGITVAVVSLIAIITVPGLLAFVWETLTFQTASSYSHVYDWTRGVVAFFEMPWGHGLGSSDQVAVRFGREALTADNTFLNYAVDMGVMGLVGHIAVLFTIGVTGWQLFKRSLNASQRILAGTVLLTTLGIALNDTSSAPFNSVFLAYNYFLLSGVAVTWYQRLVAGNPQPSSA
jgi:hypothetical protein